jgi:hypothetical protein
MYALNFLGACNTPCDFLRGTMLKLRIALFCLLGGLPLALIAPTHSAIPQSWLAGILLSACFVPVALYGPKSALAQFAVIGTAVLFVTSFCTWTEAMLFMPSAFKGHPWQALIGGSIVYLIIALILAVLARVLKLRQDAEREAVSKTGITIPAMIVAAGVCYAIYYFIFGAITFQFFTYKYYPDAARLAASWGMWFWVLQIGRGVLMTLSILPVIYTLRLSRVKLAIVAGMIVWIAGGAAPLLLPLDFMAPMQKFIHVIEIFTQNFSLGISAVYLLTRRTDAQAKALSANI